MIQRGKNTNTSKGDYTVKGIIMKKSKINKLETVNFNEIAGKEIMTFLPGMLNNTPNNTSGRKYRFQRSKDI